MPSLTRRLKISALAKGVTDQSPVYIFRNASLYPLETGDINRPTMIFTGGRSLDPARGRIAFGQVWWDAGQAVNLTGTSTLVSERSNIGRSELTPIFGGVILDPYDDYTTNQAGNRVISPPDHSFFNFYSQISNSANYGDGREVTSGPKTFVDNTQSPERTVYSQYWFQRSLGLSVFLSNIDSLDNEVLNSELDELAVGDKVKFVVHNPVTDQPLIFLATVTKGVETYGAVKSAADSFLDRGLGIDLDIGYYPFDVNNIQLVSNPDNIDDINGSYIHVSKVQSNTLINPPFSEFSTWGSVTAENYNSFDISSAGFSAGSNFRFTRTFVVRNHKKIRELDLSKFTLIIKLDNIVYRCINFSSLDGDYITAICARE